MTLDPLKYPNGTYQPNVNPSKVLLDEWIYTIEEFPKQIAALTKPLTIEQLQWRYRPHGWTIKQVVHHCADSHLNSIIRFKLALTEEQPTIRPYFEDRWAELEDGQQDDISVSLLFIEALHAKWVILLRSLTDQDLQQKFIHPERNAVFNLAETIGSYAWHCTHHLAQIKNAIAFKGKFE